MNNTKRILEQEHVLVQGIQALDTRDPISPMARVQLWFLLQAYRCPLREIMGAAPA